MGLLLFCYLTSLAFMKASCIYCQDCVFLNVSWLIPNSGTDYSEFSIRWCILDACACWDIILLKSLKLAVWWLYGIWLLSTLSYHPYGSYITGICELDQRGTQVMEDLFFFSRPWTRIHRVLATRKGTTNDSSPLGDRFSFISLSVFRELTNIVSGCVGT